MKASELAKQLIEVIAKEGDLEVGIQDVEMRDYMEIDTTSVLESTREITSSNDDSLGKRFIGISFK